MKRRSVAYHADTIASPSHSVTGRKPRSGFSLIEVIVATAILMGSVIVLARLAGMGRTMAQKTQLHSDAQRVCEQTLNEILLGLRPLEPLEQAALNSATVISESAAAMSQEPVADDRIAVRHSSGQWLHSVRLQPHPQIPSLQTLTVMVEPANDNSQRPVRFRLSRFVRMPHTEGAELTIMGDTP